MTDLGTTWSDERVELLKRLWGEGLSASRIAAQIGGVSRNAVIGKVHRLGLAGRAKPNAAAAQPRTRKADRAPSPPMPAPALDEAPEAPRVVALSGEAGAEERGLAPAEENSVALPDSTRVTIMELRESMCRWPMGDPTAPDFRFCGARAITGLPYCTHHASIAYQPAADRRRDRRLIGLRA
jgi:GcrA cell cycle regulator